MKIRSIRLENVRRFIDPVEITGIGDGLNVLTAPNERGKSTFFDALHAVFFKDRKSWDKEIRALVPYAGGDPHVMVDIEIPEGVFRISKRWNRRRRGDVRITSAGQVIKQADGAEAWIAGTLKSPKDGGPAGLLWVRQGQSNLRDGASSQRARRDLMTSVAGEVEAMTGGRRMDMARETCRKALDRYLTTSRRQARSNGPLDRAEADAATLREARNELEGKCSNLRRELDRRKDLRRELADLENPEEDATRRKRLDEAKAAHAEAARHHEELERASERERTKCADQERAAEKLKTLEKNLVELKEAQSALAVARENEDRSKSDVRTAESKSSEATKAYEEARKGAEAAVDVLRRTLHVQASVSAAGRLQELNEQLDRAEKLRQKKEQASADAGKEITDRCVTEIEELSMKIFGSSREHAKWKRQRSRCITRRGRQDGVSIDGDVLLDREPKPIPDGAELDMDESGPVGHPPRQESRVAEVLHKPRQI